MPKSHAHHSHNADLAGLARISIDAIIGITDMAEALHMNILSTSEKFGNPIHKPLSNAAALVYRSIRGAAALVGSGLNTILTKLIPVLGKNSPWPGREAVLAALNGVLGDYLAQVKNPLAIQMCMRRDGKPLRLDKRALAAAIPNPSGRILVLVHGLCMNDLEWRRRGHDHGEALARERGYTAVYLHYNSGLHISTNGRQFAEQLEALIKQWPVTVRELVILGHSMGGLVARSAHYYGAAAAHRWPGYLRKMIFLGAPHHGAPLERGGNWFHILVGISPYTAPFSNLGKIRSAGITDLRYGNLLDQDWQGHDRFAHVGDQRQPLPLPAKVACYTIAATTGKQAGDISDRLLGDGLVPLESALGRHRQAQFKLQFPKKNQLVLTDMNHLSLLNRDAVYHQLLAWL